MSWCRSVEKEKLRGKTNRWHKWRIALIAFTILGFVPVVQADKDDDLPELPSIEVRGVQLSMPVLEKTIIPRLPEYLIGTEVRMTFKIGKNGKPYAIRCTAGFDCNQLDLGSVMTQNMKYWRFRPVMDKHGKPYVAKAVLPVKVVASGKGNAGNYASIALSDPILLAVLD